MDTLFRAIAASVVWAWATSLCLASPAGTLRIPALDANVKTVGGKVGPPQEAEAAWNLWSNGELGDFIRFPAAGLYKVTIRAKGSPAKGEWPEMALLLDGGRLGTATVSGGVYADYSFEANVAAGTHRLLAAFLNDAAVADPNRPGQWIEDRNLYVSRIEIQSRTGGAAPVLGIVEEWAVEAGKAEEKVLKDVAGRMESSRKAAAVVRVTGAGGKPLAAAAVSAELVRHEFLFGCNIYMFDHFKTPAENEQYKKRFADLFNFATVGFYWRGYEPVRGRPNYDYTDKVAAWCGEHGIRMKGHPLLWGLEYGIPPWSKGQPDANVQRQRVTDILRRYAGRITMWEVVNEPSHINEPKIDEPYRWARSADGNAYLIVNDYEVMADGCPKFLALLKKAIADGVPFDGIGIQAHEPRTMRFPLEKVWETLDQYAALGKDLYITEFTPASSGDAITGSPVTGKWDEKAQEDYAVKFYRVCFAHPAVKGITWWDLCDQGSWLPGGGLLRKDLSPKPAYEALRKLIHEEWRTSAAGRTNEKGEFAFRGFAGQYEITVTAGGRKVAARFRLPSGKGGACTLTIPE